MGSISLPLNTYELRSKSASSTRLVNCYIEQMPADSKTPLKLTRCHGVSDWTTVGTGPILAMHVLRNVLYVVSGPELYSVTNNKLVTLLGNIGAPVSIDIASNKTDVVVVNEPNLFSWDGTTFSAVTDADFTSRGAGDVAYMSNTLLFREPSSDRFFGADTGSSTSFDALQFANADVDPDDLNGMVVDHNQIFLTGPKQCEIWQSSGGANFPFARAINGYIEQGCLNGKTIAKQDQTVFWVANDHTVRRLEGLTPMRVSTHAVEQALQDGSPAYATAYGYSQDGHLFYVLTMPEGTFVYDVTTQQWHERRTYGVNHWTQKTHVQAFNLELVGDSTSNKIGFLSPTDYDEFGGIHRMEWTYQTIYGEGQSAFHDRFEIILETGVGLTTGQGVAPEIMLDYSDDSGRTWTSLPNRSIGPLGQYEDRAIWFNLGQSRNRAYRAAVSDPVRVTVTDTLLEMRGGRL